MKILAIESSCDETACAIVEDGKVEISSALASSKELHEATGGVVPEVAARKQIEFLVPVIDQTLKKGGFTRDGKGIDAIAVTVGPGLIGSLMVGVEGAKALAFAWDKPLVPVNHLIGHIYANFIERVGTVNADPVSVFPCIALVISGGHTDLVLLRGHGDMEYIGGTLDDAAGEAYDKTARLLGLSKYLGGAKLSALAASCTNNQAQGVLPRPMLDQNNFDFSFSGLKTAVKRIIESGKYTDDSIACEFETAVTDVVVDKTLKACIKFGCTNLLVGGGVAANNYLRTRLSSEAGQLGISMVVPPLDLCTDNAIYIASCAYYNYRPVSFDKVEAIPGLNIIDKFI